MKMKKTTFAPYRMLMLTFIGITITFYDLCILSCLARLPGILLRPF